jgi:glucokinase-like ROK family protein
VLELIWQQRQISRADIARQLGLSRSTVSEIVSHLLETELVAQGGDGPSRGGRRPILLTFNDSAHVILGVDMGSTHVSVVLTDLRGRELFWEHRDHPVRTDPEGTERLVTELSDLILTRHGGARKRLLGVGVAVPSPVDPLRPKQVSEVLLPHWSGRGVMEQLQSAYGVPVVVDNDANLGAVAEHWWGAGRGLSDFTYIKLGTGVGSGHMIGGQIYRGASGVAGEIGHMVIHPGGLPCSCGNRGCLETLVGTRALLARVEELVADFPGTVLQGRELTIQGIEEAAVGEDPLALALVNEVARHLSVAVAGVLNMLNPSAVILGGSLARLGPMLLSPVKEGARAQTLVNSIAASRIVVSELGPRAIAKGAATMVLDNALADPRMFPSLAEK